MNSSFSGFKHVTDDLAHEDVQRWRPARAELPFAVRVAIEIRDELLLSVPASCFSTHSVDPIKAELFRIPQRELDGSLRFPTGLPKFGQGPRRLEHGDCAAGRIVRAIDPCVVMIAVDYPLVRKFRSREWSRSRYRRAASSNRIRPSCARSPVPGRCDT